MLPLCVAFVAGACVMVRVFISMFRYYGVEDDAKELFAKIGKRQRAARQFARGNGIPFNAREDTKRRHPSWPAS